MPDDKYSILVDTNPLKLRDLAHRLEAVLTETQGALDRVLEDSLAGYTTMTGTAEKLVVDALSAANDLLAEVAVLEGYD